MMLTCADQQGLAGVPDIAGHSGRHSPQRSFNLPVEGIAVILGVDTLMDMARTSVNLLGNCLATAVVARWEGVKLPDGPMTVEPEFEPMEPVAYRTRQLKPDDHIVPGRG